MPSEQRTFPIHPNVLSVLEELWSAGHAAYLVGGAVRDAILGLPLRDSGGDIATDARPERILEIFPGSTYENRFGTVLAHGHEITTFRRDHRYADHRHPQSITFSDDVYEDLARRDLTINAIAWGKRGVDAEVREIDPADGRSDLEARLVRAVGDPARRFEEDALRLLRAVRIAARLDFVIEPITHAAMSTHAGDIRWVSEERVGTEIRRMLTVSPPSRALRMMDATGILAAALPELTALRRMPSSHSHAEPETRLEHALTTTDVAMAHSDGAERLVWAALLHSLAPEVARSILERLRFAGRDTEAISRLIALLSFDIAADASDADVRRFMCVAGAAPLDEAMSLRRSHAEAVADAAALARAERLQARVAGQLAAAVPLTLGELAIDGADLREVLGVPEGPPIGRVLEALLDDVIEDPALNQRTTLLTRANLLLADQAQALGSAAGGPVSGHGLGSAK